MPRSYGSLPPWLRPRLLQLRLPGRYAEDKHWKAIGGMSWQGDDPDFWPIYLAHGASQPGCSHWDFTHAVRFLTDGQHANHGFMLHGDSKDWFRAWYREAPKVKASTGSPCDLRTKVNRSAIRSIRRC